MTDSVEVTSIGVINEVKNIQTPKPTSAAYIVDVAKYLYTYQTFETAEGKTNNAAKLAQKCIERARIFFDALPDDLKRAVTEG